MPLALNISGSRPMIDTSTVFVPGLGPSVSVASARPFASVVAYSIVNRPLSFPAPAVTLNVTCTSGKGLVVLISYFDD